MTQDELEVICPSAVGPALDDHAPGRDVIRGQQQRPLVHHTVQHSTGLCLGVQNP